MAEALRDKGIDDVWLESEIEANDGLPGEGNRPLILLDAVDLNEDAGKVTLLPLNIVLENSSLSHKILPVVSEILGPTQMQNAFLLGIQAESLETGPELSSAVRRALETVVTHLTN